MSKGAEPDPTPSKFNMETLNSAVQTLAIVLAGAWAVYTFIYEAKIAPGLAPPSVSVTSTLERVGQKDGMVAIRSTVTRTNVGQAEVRVLGLTYNVVGVKVRFGEAVAASAMPDELPRSSTVAQARHYDEPEGGEVILRHGVLFEGATALPSEPSGLTPARPSRATSSSTPTRPGSILSGSRSSCPTRSSRSDPCRWFSRSAATAASRPCQARTAERTHRGAEA
jgi:hypothetical protein